MHIARWCGALYLLFAIVGSGAARCRAAEPVSFNKQIRPILADRCYTCHGPDSASREAGLRLDREESAKHQLDETGNVAIVPGKPDDSEMMVRLTDSDQLMPPPDSMLTVSKAEIALIRRWIAEGADWERHWSFLPPVKVEPPVVADASWPRNSLDHFVLHRLQAEGLKPSPPADRERWLRRVTFDLTGLPPSIDELREFLADKSEQACDHAVERLLDSPAFGERMALEWLDVARYGDTDGLFEDHARSIYPWRDWVIDAFNKNLPYSDFLSWQLAGDLLPNATVPQRIATGFLRNNPTSNEGGIIDEDYRVKYLVDRVNTTATATLGLTLECAQCHDHKYDPMTQREYYQFAGFFNSLVGNGNTKGTTAPTLRSFEPEQELRLNQIAKELAAVETTLASDPADLKADFKDWLASLETPVDWRPTSLVESKLLREDDGWLVAVEEPEEPKPDAKEEPPTMRGRFVRVALPPSQSGFLTISEVQVFSAGRNIAVTGKATQSSIDYDRPAAKAIDGNHNGSFATCSCTKSEKDAWWEVDLQGEFPITSVSVWNRTDCCPERLDRVSIRILDSDRKQVAERILKKAAPRNSLPEGVDESATSARDYVITLAASNSIAALQLSTRQPQAIELLKATVIRQGEKDVALKWNGARKARIHKDERAVFGFDSPLKMTDGQHLRLTFRAAALSGIRVSATSNPTAAVRDSLPKEREQRLSHFRKEWPGFAAARRRKEALEKEKQAIESAAVLTMVAADSPKPRTNHFLKRGEYDNRGEVLETAAPASIMAYPKDLPRNRLGLARWLTHPDNPLTARVAVNRYWQMLFGQGIVKTSEDFGTQGAQPTHQELLDYLSVEFIASGWNVKELIRRIVLSATYRQASHRRPGVTSDPDNQLLSRGPRRRLQAEFLRDHALSISGLLVDKRGGPGVNPYQPAELFGRNAIGAANTKFTQGRGDDLYRRSLYTYWKRQIPAANMRLLGADGRTTCRTRRESTNTPLQALVMLNDPQFVEAARALAARSIREGGASPAERLRFAFRLATSRQVREPELAILLREFEDRRQDFGADVESAKRYLAGGGEHKPDAKMKPAELAAYAAVCSLILNLDESLSSS